MRVGLEVLSLLLTHFHSLYYVGKVIRILNDGGRFITGKCGNIVVGFWNNMKDVVHMNEFLSRGTSADTGANAIADLFFFVLRSDRK